MNDGWIEIALAPRAGIFLQLIAKVFARAGIDAVTDRVAGTNFGHYCRLAVTIIELVTYAVIFWYGVIWVMRAQATFQSIPWLQVRWAYAAIPVSAFFMTIYGVRDLVLAVREFLPKKAG